MKNGIAKKIDRRNKSEKRCMQVRVLVRSTRTNERRCSAGVDAKQAQSADVGKYLRGKEGGSEEDEGEADGVQRAKANK